MHDRPGADAVELVLTGDVDDLTVCHLDDGLGWVVEHMTQRHVLVDVSGVSRLEPSGVEALLRARSRLCADRRTLVLRGDSGVAHAALEAAGLLDPSPVEEESG
jgi:anti-sigma B factor antagonist